MLESAYADGRLSWDEFDARTTRLLNSFTYDQLATLTSDLPGQAPAAPPQVYQPGYPPQRSTNSMAVVAMVAGIAQFLGFWLLGTIPAIICGHIARRQIRQTGEAGDGMALAGVILGWVGAALSVLAIIAFIALFAVAASHPAIPSVPQPVVP